MNKNEEYTVTIEDIGSDGEGIGHIIETGLKDKSLVKKGLDKSGIGNDLSDEEKGITCFVKDTVVGDEVKVKIIKVKKNYVYGRLMEIITPSPYRVEAVCPKARSCGGCTLMHMSYDRQLEYKKNKVISCLERIGGIKDAGSLVEDIYGMDTPYNYRNKMQFPVGVDKDGNIRIGFYAGRTHSIIDIDECATGHKINTFIIKNLRAWISEAYKIDKQFVYNEELHKGLVRHIVTRVGFSTGELSVCLVINGEKLNRDKALDDRLKSELISALCDAVGEYNKCLLDINEVEESNDLDTDATKNNPDIDKSKLGDKAGSEIKLSNISLNINKEKTNKILGYKNITIYGEDYITDYIGDVRFNVSPQSFFQVNPVQTKVLYDKALSYADLTGNEAVWDMYCGIGTISLFLAQKAKKVYGVEIVPQAIEDAKKNALLNNLSNTEFYCGKAEELAPTLYEKEGIKPDVIVVDPPRKGCDTALLDTIDKISPKRLVYVSCDPATLARDIKYLSEKGFEVKKVAVVDQFCHSVHVESVCFLSNINQTS
ncbi:MAG: 23S rRNA (uracil(1939)-C(5))-methyltransferase RlmD [Lachnospiraceae bacterium]|nr:23S rRNA (uracil(1939)-C(5))-methyltransferase RlmD [Lachnospiraceae bacterium]